jgi:hypothetical protein
MSFTYFFLADSYKVQVAMTLIVALMLSLNVMLVFFYGRPYVGDSRIKPKALIHLRELLKTAPILQPGVQKTVKP